MRKKLLTVALAAVMSLGCAFSAFAVESPEVNNSSSTTNGVESTEDVGISETEAATIQKGAKIDLANDSLVVSVVSKQAILDVQTAGATILKGKTYIVADLSLASKTEQLDKAIKVTLPLFESLKDAKYINVYRYNETTKALDLLTKDAVKVNDDGTFTFETDHFSTYVFAEASAPVATDDKPEPETGDTAPIATAVAVAALAAASFAVVALKKKNA